VCFHHEEVIHVHFNEHEEGVAVVQDEGPPPQKLGHVDALVLANGQEDKPNHQSHKDADRKAYLEGTKKQMGDEGGGGGSIYVSSSFPFGLNIFLPQKGPTSSQNMTDKRN
jgi:hypothetical protein